MGASSTESVGTTYNRITDLVTEGSIFSMARYHLRFKRFHPATLRATDELFKSKPWEGTDDEKQDKFERWLRQVANVYGIPAPQLEIADDPLTLLMAGGYQAGAMTLPKFSVLTMFHEFRHHMQFCGVGRASEVYGQDRAMEEDAAGWSCSLFYTSRPTLFRKAVRAGGVFHVQADDLMRTVPDVIEAEAQDDDQGE
jgi:hypothetical protein